MARIFGLAMAAALTIVLTVEPSRAQNAYITNEPDDTVSVIDTTTNTMIGLPAPMGCYAAKLRSRCERSRPRRQYPLRGGL
jgi:hypothetical protein